MILKIALGVFLGLAAWTYRSNLIGYVILLLVLSLVALIGYWCYKLIANPIKKKIAIKSIEEVTDELLTLGLVEKNILGALRLGLIERSSESKLNSLKLYLQDYKKSLRSGENDNFYKKEIRNLVDSIVEDFKTDTILS